MSWTSFQTCCHFSVLSCKFSWLVSRAPPWKHRICAPASVQHESDWNRSCNFVIRQYFPDLSQNFHMLKDERTDSLNISVQSVVFIRR